MRSRRLLPRRAGGLPPGQRLLDVMPRFGDDPRRPPPSVPDGAALEVVVEGTPALRIDAGDVASRRVARRADFHCVTGWSVRDLEWEGISLCDLVGELELPAYALAAAHDGAVACFRRDDLLDERTLVATHLGGRPLDARHGAPLRLVTPHLYGYKNVKHLARIEFVASEPPSRLGPKEHLRARVDREERHARLPNWLVRPAYRLVVPPTIVVAERSLERTSDTVPGHRRTPQSSDA